jgi:cytochrome c peroxidase
MNRTLGLALLGALTMIGCGGGGSAASFTPTPSAQIEVGRALFFDTTLSEPAGQSCASCHAPDKGFTDPRPGPTSEGAVAGNFGARNAPTAAYAMFAPPLRYDAVNGTYQGGLFLDGRVDSLEQQAQGPPLNPIEMHNPDRAAFVAKVAAGPQATRMKALFGGDLFTDTDRAFAAIASVLGAFERSAEVSPFTSKYDAFLRGTATLTAQERRGLALFEGRAGCAACHPNGLREDGTLPLFTDFTYDNLGVPRNPANPFYAMPASVNPDGAAFVDLGLAGNAKVIADGRAAESRGKFKVPTLRNLAKTGPYMHNGVFTSLKEVVAFYNRRDLEPTRFGAPEVAETVNREELGNLGLSDDEEDALVAFLLTLTDGYTHP